MALDITKIGGLIKVVADDATAYINLQQARLEVKGTMVQIHSELQEITLEGSAPFTGDGESKTLEEFINYITITIN
tara:strand:+ start:176 stop:403 length:228 start_codon:yes stop_codon:yes gene_type:complete